MNFQEYLLSQGVSEEQVTSIVNGMPKNKLFITNEEKLEDRYGKLKQQKEELETDLTTANTLVEGLKKANKDSEGLQQQIDSYQEQIKTLNETREQDKKETAIEFALKDAKVKSTKAVRAFLDFDGIKVEGDTLEGLDKQLSTLKEKEAYLFEEETPPTPSVKQAVFGGNPSGGTKEEIPVLSKLSYAEALKLSQENPTLYEEVVKTANIEK